MVVAAVILLIIACLCFLMVAGNVTTRINPLGMGLFCLAFWWLLQVLHPLAQ